MRSVTPPDPHDAHSLPATVSVVTAGRYFGLGRDAAYAMARRNAFPCPVLRLGGRYRVTRSALLAALGLPGPGNPLATPVNPQVKEVARDV